MVTKVLATPFLAVVACLIAAETASAQGFPWSRQGEYLYREQPAYQQPNFAPSAAPATADTNRSFYPSSFLPVRIEVTAPANAKISFAGQATRQTGARRLFESPPLEYGYRYNYAVEATWMENGRQVTQRRVFPVQAGDEVRIAITGDSINITPAQ